MVHKRWLWIIIVVTIFLVGLLTTGTIYQSNSTIQDMILYPAPGDIISVDGDDMHIYCIGEGSPTVLFEAGLGGNYMDWVLIQPAIGEHTRACTYDRAGMGYSDYVGSSLDTKATVERLHQLLNVAEVEAPYILVGHSIGGIHVRSLYELYPEDVIGMVLLDSSHENQGQYLPEPPIIARIMYNIAPFLARVGLIRVLGLSQQQAEHLTSEQTAQVSAMYNRTDFWQALKAENQMALVDTNQQIPPPSMGNLPLNVISQDVAAMRAQNPELASLWIELQGELTELSTNSTYILAKDSGHYVHYDRPQIVINVILSLLQNMQE